MTRRFLIAFFTTIFIVAFITAIIVVENGSNSVMTNSQGEFYIQKTNSAYKYYIHLSNDIYEVSLLDIKPYINELKASVKYIEPIAPRTVSLIRYINDRITE